MSDPAESDALLAELAADLADQVTRRYRVDHADAAALILDDFRRRPKLLAAVANANSAADVRRLRVYCDAVAATKRGIYYQLRRYLARPATFDDALRTLAGLPSAAPPDSVADAARAVLAAHVSTAERLPHADEFLAMVAAAVGGGGTVVDVACGVLPLMHPAGWLGDLGVREYWALDKDPHAHAAVAEYARIRADQRIRPVEWDIASGWEPLFRSGLPRGCGAGLLLKIVPVVARQSPELLAVLAATPADRLLISGSRVAMAKRQDIERRELRSILRFCAAHGFRQRDEFRTADEICLLVERA